MNTKNVAKLAKQVGEVIEDENPWVDGVLSRTFFRVRVNVNIQEPFVTGYWFLERIYQSPGSFSDMKDFRIFVIIMD